MGHDGSEVNYLKLNFQVFLGIILLVGFVLALLGNLIMFISISVLPYMQGRTFNFLLLNLAAGDIVMAITAQPLLSVYFVFYWPSWPLPDPVCKMAAYIFETSSTAAILTILLLTLESYFCIVKDKSLPRKVLAFALVFIWTVSISLNAPFLIGKAVTVQPVNQSICHLIYSSRSHSQLYVVTQITKATIFFCFLAAGIYLTAGSFFALRGTENTPGLLSDNDEVVQARKRKSFNLMLAILLGSVVCQVPYWITLLLRLSDSQLRVKIEVLLLVYGLLISRPALVPVITSVLSTRFRSAYVEVLKTRSCISGDSQKTMSNLQVDPLTSQAGVETDSGKMTYKAFLRHGSRTQSSNEEAHQVTQKESSESSDNGGRDNDSYDLDFNNTSDRSQLQSSL